MLIILGIIFYSFGLNYEKNRLINLFVTVLTPSDDIKKTISNDTKNKLIETGIPSTCVNYKYYSTQVIFIYVCFLLLFITIFATYFATYYIPISQISSIIVENIIIFIILIFFELIFFYYIILKYNYDELINNIKKAVIKYIK
jgi:hypothetical protein